ncbi:unnamed protein product [Cylicocyclus nassatus]|uniref:Uncharacterized protein n=1 Tax=Cylicocyclus nassatus TaxID=53992 RepID=A0AA36GNN5_CYLNA|nr:unnamed protein product [Cylicocyclus nassatus]
MESFALVFYSRSKDTDVVSTDDIIGDLAVGVQTRVLVKGKTYAAKILCMGDKEYCERKLDYVTKDGVLENPNFRVCDGTLGNEMEAGCPTDKELLRKLSASMDEVLSRLTRLETEMARKDLQLEAAQLQQRGWSALGELRANVQEVLKRVPKRTESEEALAFDYASAKFLESLRKLCGGNVNKFALELEKKVYEGDTAELILPLEKRIQSATKVEFIKECIFKYYMVPVEARQTVWRTAKNALNSRVRRLKSATGGTPSRRAALFEVESPQAQEPSPYEFVDD